MIRRRSVSESVMVDFFDYALKINMMVSINNIYTNNISDYIVYFRDRDFDDEYLTISYDANGTRDPNVEDATPCLKIDQYLKEQKEDTGITIKYPRFF
jgi:hypothetical protein